MQSEDKQSELDPNQAAQQLATIRRIMESATQITVLPGWAAIVGGLVALVGCAVSYVLMGSLDFAVMNDLTLGDRYNVVAVWVAVGTLGVAIDVLMTIRLARQRGRRPWPRLAQLAAHAMAPALCCALLISIVLAERSAWDLIPAVWMLHYGVAVWMAGILSVRAPGVLGLLFMAAGATTLLCAVPISLLVVAATFGLCHIVYGIFLLVRFGS